MQVKRVCLHAVQLTVGADLWLSLVKIGLCARFAIQLFDVVRARIEQVAVVRLLVARREPTEDEDVFIGDLVQAAPLQANPVRILFYPQVERLPVLPPLDVVLLDQVGPLAAIEAGHHVKCLIVERDGRVEVASRVETGDLGPSVAPDVVHFTLVHRFAGQ